MARGMRVALGIAFLAASSSLNFSNDAFWNSMILTSAGLSIGHPIPTQWMTIIGIRTVSTSYSVLSIRVKSSRTAWEVHTLPEQLLVCFVGPWDS